MEINIYSDESRHLEKDKSKAMAIGAITCPKAEVKNVIARIIDIKRRHGVKKDFEIKWSKVSPSKLPFYVDLVDLYFDIEALGFRGVIVPDKQRLDHEKFNQTHDEFIYKLHFETLKALLHPKNSYFIYIDMKDTQGGRKIKKLHDILCNSHYDFQQRIIRTIVQVQAEQILLSQICDLLLGALVYLHNEKGISKAKQEIIRRIQHRSGYNLRQTTLVGERKMNILIFDRA